MTERDLHSWMRGVESEEPPELWDDISTRTPSGRPPRQTPKALRYAGVALVTVLVAAGIILPLKALWPLGDREKGTPAGPGLSEGETSMYPGLWPERTLAEAQRVQAAVEGGDASQQWRTDPKEVAKRFVMQVMGWPEAGLSVELATPEQDTSATPEQVDRVAIAVRRMPPPCPSPGCPWWMTSTQYVTLDRVVPDGNIWAVVLTNTIPQIRNSYGIGWAVSTDAPLTGSVDPGDDRHNDVYWGAAKNAACSGGEILPVPGRDVPPDVEGIVVVVATDYGSFYRTPDCSQTGDGYIAFGLTTKREPFADPLASPDGSRYIPAMFLAPARFIVPPTPTASPSYALTSNLTEEAIQMATNNGDATPERIEVVDTEAGQVTAMLNDTLAVHGPQHPVTFVQVTGSFICHTCKQPTDEPITGTALWFVWDHEYGRVSDWGLAPEPYDLTQLGSPFDLPVPSPPPVQGGQDCTPRPDLSPLLDELTRTKAELVDLNARIAKANPDSPNYAYLVAKRTMDEGRIRYLEEQLVGVENASPSQGWCPSPTVEGSPAAMIAVPSVIGMTPTEAKTRLEVAGLSVGAITYVPSGSVRPGAVVAQDPSAGGKVAPGTAVGLRVSVTK